MLWLTLKEVGCLFTFVHLTYMAVAATEGPVRKCFPGNGELTEGNVSLVCPEKHTISISDAVLGRSKWGLCRLTSEDCVVLNVKIFDECDGLEICNRTFKTFTSKCGYSTVLLLDYRCTPISTFITTTTSTVATSSAYVPVHGSSSSPNAAKPNDGDGQDNDGSQRETKDDQGLIIATVVASVVTTIMLIVAIIMTIRRLINYPSQGDHREASRSRLVSCVEHVCVHVDKLPCVRSSNGSQGEQSLRSRKSSSTTPATTTEADKMQRTRIEPVGQESSDHSNEPNLVMNAHSSDSAIAFGETVEENSSQKQDAKKSSYIKELEMNSVMYKNDNCQEKMNSWDTKKIDKKSINNNVDDFPLHKEKIPNANRYPLEPSAPDDPSSSHSINVTLPRMSQMNNHVQTPRFDAVSIPNTETGTLC